VRALSALLARARLLSEALGRARSLSIKAKIAVAMVSCLGVVALVNASLAYFNYKRDMRREAEHSVQAAARAFQAVERREIERLSSTLDALLLNPAFAAFFAQRDRDRLQESAAPVLRELSRHGISLWSFIDPPPSRECFLRVHRPELYGDRVGGAALDLAVRGGTGAGVELGRTALALRVVRPVLARGRLLGYVELGEPVEALLSRLRDETGDELGLVLHREYLEERPGSEAREALRAGRGGGPEALAVLTNPDAPILGTGPEARQVPDGGRFLGRIAWGPLRFVRGVVPLRDPAERQVGALFVLHDENALRSRVKGEQLRDMVLIGLLALALLGVLLAAFEVLVFRRLVRMTRAMEDVSTRLAGGDYEIGGTVAPTARDEIGRFEAFLGSFLATIGATLRQLEQRRRGGG
jgi:HAMP domain-containing protein